MLELPDPVTGVPCLDFVNTVDERYLPTAREWLTTPAHTVAWAARLGLVDEELAARLRRALRERRRWATARHAVLLRRREHLYRLLLAHVERREPGEADLATVSGWIAGARGHAVLRPRHDGFRLGWPDEPTIDRIGWPLADSAARLLTEPRLADVGRCANGGCGWLYLDTTRNHSRRWCSMRLCGNAVKVRRFRDAH